MSRRQEILNARANRLQGAVMRACDRKHDTETPLVVKLLSGVHPVMILAGDQEKGGPAYATLGFSCQIDVVPSFRVGRNSRDEFFELKLVPSESMLALPVVADDLPEGVFVTVEAEELIFTYTGREIQRLIRLLVTP